MNKEESPCTYCSEPICYYGGCPHLPQPDYEEQPPSDAAMLSCKDCPDDECTGHCMSCAYRSL